MDDVNRDSDCYVDLEEEEKLVTKDELNKIIEEDSYHKKRENPSEADLRLYLREVDYHCPLCGAELQSRNQKKKEQKRFQIAHIYPNSPTVEQYLLLHSLERLGENCEDFENKVALCLVCHQTQDFHTTVDEYNHLLNIKKRCLVQTALHDATNTLGIENEIDKIVDAMTNLLESDLAELNYEPVPIAKKFTSQELLLKVKTSGYVTSFYPYIRDAFRELDGKNGFHLQILSEQIRGAFLKMESISKDKTLIFSKIVEWIKNKTQSNSVEACEAIVSFFVQNCEVFYEITE